ncbi:MAG TPA: thiamine-phosphate kinase [Acidimicrobiales bacterium]|nr:thiamine-phosphate kinase [Acidimicrobiales bacterium]
MNSPNSGGRGRPEVGLDEFTAIGTLQGQFEAAARARLPAGAVPPVGDTWIGDDAAVVRLRHPDGPGPGPADQAVLATDMVVAGVHFDLGLSGLDDVGYKALMVTVSDFAAMGARPEYALVSVAAPAGTDIERLGSGLAAASHDASCVIVGGDLSESAVLVVSTSAVGWLPPSDYPPLLRSGAGPSDQLFVTGPLGRSAAGLRLLRQGGRPDGVDEAALTRAHRRPVARLAQGEVARRAGATAAIDLSDGLVADVGHLARASGVGVDLDAIPVAPLATREEALTGGEDYELLVATGRPDELAAAYVVAGLPLPVRIGTCTERVGVYTLDGDPLPSGGWRHRF